MVHPVNMSIKKWSACLLLVVIGYALYQHILSFGFAFFDDNTLILDRYNFLRQPANVIKAFRQDVFGRPNPYVAYYRPLLTLSLMVDSWVGGVSPFQYHLTNIIIHIVAGCLLFLFLLKLRYKADPALFFSVLFIVHPALTQAVAWIPGRNDSLLTVFVLSSFLAFIKFLETKNRLYYLLNLLFFACALLTKESAIALIALFILYFYTIRKNPIPLFTQMVSAAGWFIFTALWFVLRKFALAGFSFVNVYDVMESTILNMSIFVQSLGKVFFPFNLSTFPAKYDTSSIYGIAAIMILAVFLARSRHKRIRFIFFGFAWFVLFLLPSFVRVIPHISSSFLSTLEHRMYLPMIGIIIMASEIDMLKDMDLRRRVVLIGAVLVILIFSITTFLHSINFKDMESFWMSASRSSPRSAVPHLNVGRIWYLKGNLDMAEAEYRKSLELNPHQPMAHAKLGVVYEDRNMPVKAEEEFKKEIAINPLYDGSWTSLGALYYKQGKFAAAEDLWKRAIGVNPDSFDAHKNLAIYYRERKDYKNSYYHARALQEGGFSVPPEFLQDKE